MQPIELTDKSYVFTLSKRQKDHKSSVCPYETQITCFSLPNSETMQYASSQFKWERNRMLVCTWKERQTLRLLPVEIKDKPYHSNLLLKRELHQRQIIRFQPSELTDKAYVSSRPKRKTNHVSSLAMCPRYLRFYSLKSIIVKDTDFHRTFLKTTKSPETLNIQTHGTW